MKKEEFKKKDELTPYKSDKLAKIPSLLKILLLKYWAAAAAFYFFAIGNKLVDPKDQNAYVWYFIWIGFGLGLFLEYIVKSIVRLMRNSRDDTYRFNLVNKKGVLSLFLNIVYGLAISYVMVYILVFLASKGWILDLFGLDEVPAIEPFTGGFVFIILDAIVVGIKDLILYLYKRHIFIKNEKKTEAIISNMKNAESKTEESEN